MRPAWQSRVEFYEILFFKPVNLSVLLSTHTPIGKLPPRKLGFCIILSLHCKQYGRQPVHQSGSFEGGGAFHKRLLVRIGARNGRGGNGAYLQIQGSLCHALMACLIGIKIDRIQTNSMLPFLHDRF